MDIAAKFNDLKQVTPEQWLQRSTAILPPWITVLLVVAIAWQLSQLVWRLYPVAAEPVINGPASVERPAATGSGSGADVAKIVSAHLFGEARSDIVVEDPAGPDADLDEFDGQLTLTATIAANDPERARAIIGDSSGEQNVYQVGETIQAGVSLDAIYRDQVTLLNRGKREALPLPMAGDGSAAPTPNRRTASSNRATARPTQPRRQPSVRDTLTRDPAKLTNLIRPQPVFANGKQLGYRVYPGRMRQEFARLGLKPGDLVTEINGTQLNDPAKGLDIFRTLADATQVSVTVERNGSPQVLVLDTQSLNLSGDSPGTDR